ncbi:hypothetical protein D3C76_948540 [compost metagenome]
MPLDHLGNRLLASAAHACTGRVVQARGQHHDARAGGTGDPIQIIGNNALIVQGDAMQRQAQLPAGGLDAGGRESFDQHCFARLAQ